MPDTPFAKGPARTPRTQLSAHAADKRLFVDDVVTALTGTVEASNDAGLALQDQMKRATDEFDLRTAEAFARALLEALCQDPIDPRRLEALLILGLAHPTILERHRISLPKEGERLAAMLIAQGQNDRARTLMAVIAKAVASAPPEDPAETVLIDDADDEPLVFTTPARPAPTPFQAKAVQPAPTPASNPAAVAAAASNERDHAKIEALLRKADEQAARGRTSDAIHCLQQVVALDRNRRDVARMIHDLRWQDQERRARTVRRLKLAVLVVLLAAGITGLVWRESGIRRRFAAIPAATEGDVSSMRARLDAIDGMIAGERAWFGMSSAVLERGELVNELQVIEDAAAAKIAAAALVRTQSSELAEVSRTSGMLLAQQGKFEDAVVELRRALELGGAAWSQRQDVESNVTAITEWIEKRPERRGPGR